MNSSAFPRWFWLEFLNISILVYKILTWEAVYLVFPNFSGQNVAEVRGFYNLDFNFQVKIFAMKKMFNGLRIYSVMGMIAILAHPCSSIGKIMRQR